MCGNVLAFSLVRKIARPSYFPTIYLRKIAHCVSYCPNSLQSALHIEKMSKNLSWK